MIKKYAIYTARKDIESLLYFNVADVEYYDYPDCDIFLNLSGPYKIAVLEVDYQRPHLVVTELERFKNCDKVILYSMEFNLTIKQAAQQYDLSNFIFIMNGYILDFEFKNAQYITITNWISSTVYLWTDWLTTSLKEKLSPFVKKSYHFEVMYGKRRLNRSYVANYILENNLAPYVLQTPYFSLSNDSVNGNYNLDQSVFWEDEIIPNATVDYGCTYREVPMLISQVLPFKIYQQSAFSIVCESSFDNSYVLTSEKIAKPLLCLRMFIVISGQYYLKYLRSLGFKTFDGIIDESYDKEPDNQKRWTMAMQQVALLCQQDQTKILKSIVPIVLHNRDLVTRLPTNQLHTAVETVLLDKELTKI